MCPCVHCSFIYNSQDMERTQLSFDWWLDKEDLEDLINGILLSHKIWNIATQNNMNRSRDYHQKWSKKRARTIWFHSNMGCKTNSKKSHRHRQDCGGYQRGGGLGEGWREWMGSICGDKTGLDFGWRAYSGIHGWCVIQLYIWNVYKVINQRYPPKSMEKHDK